MEHFFEHKRTAKVIARKWKQFIAQILQRWSKNCWYRMCQSISKGLLRIFSSIKQCRFVRQWTHKSATVVIGLQQSVACVWICTFLCVHGVVLVLFYLHLNRKYTIRPNRRRFLWRKHQGCRIQNIHIGFYSGFLANRTFLSLLS